MTRGSNLPRRVALLVAIAVLLAFLVYVAGPHSTHRVSSVTVVQTDGAIGEQMTTLAALPLTPDAGHRAEDTIRIDTHRPEQTFWGVGAAVTDSSAYLIHGLAAPTQSRLLRQLYGRAGLGLSFGAIPIGASDYTAAGYPYSYDDLPAGQVDPQLLHFSVRHDAQWDLPVLREITAIAPRIRFFATTWSAPPWMKANDRFNDLNFAGSLLPRYYGSFARYLVDWLEAYRARGIHIAALSPENEPNSPSHVPAMSLSLSDQVKFITRNLAPALASSHLSTQIFGGDVGMRRLDEQKALVASPAGRDLGGLAWHCYSAPPTEMSLAARVAPGLDQIVSECAEKLSRVPLAVDVLGALANHAVGFSAWNLALTPEGGPVQLPNHGCAGCRGLVAINPKTGRYSLSEEAYVLGQVGHFVEPGAVRLSTTDEPVYRVHGTDFNLEPNTGILNVAYRNPGGQIALIVYNPAAVTKTVRVTDGSENFTARLPKGATTTFTWRP